MKNLKKIFAFLFVFICLNILLLFSVKADYEDVPNINSPSAILLDLNTGKILFEKNIDEKMYPASLTKVMTAIIVLEECELDEIVTVSYDSVMSLSSGYVTANLQIGEEFTVEQMLYVMMVGSSNDAAIVLAEHVSGSIDEFSKLMNEKAINLGCTSTNFVNPNGVHDENHYTTVYDMYLILNAAIQNEDFYRIFTSDTYTANYTSGGQTKTVEWGTTTQYHSGKVKTPVGFTILGGKTGTTGAAGYCLVLLSENEEHDRIISIVYNADCRSNLYLLMNEILSNYCI